MRPLVPDPITQSPFEDPVAKLRVICIEDDAGMRQLLGEIINSDPRLLKIGDFENISSAIENLHNLTPEVVVLDIRLPGKRGIEAISDIKKISPGSKVLVFTISGDNDDLFDALKAGADGYLLKRSSPDDIIKAIVAVHEGGSPMTPAISRKVVEHFRSTTHEKSAEEEEPLTRRQTEILEQLSRGLSVKEIADILRISVLTTRFHIRMIYKRLKVSSQTQALLKYMERSSSRRPPTA